MQHNKIKCHYQSLSTLDQFMFPSICVNLKKRAVQSFKVFASFTTTKKQHTIKKDDHENNTKTLLRSNSCTVKQLAFDQLKKTRKAYLKLVSSMLITNIK